MPGRGRRPAPEDPDGNGVLLSSAAARAAEDRWPPVARPRTRARHHPRKLGHVNYLTADTPRWSASTRACSASAISDWIGDGACWLHVNADHHVLASLDKGCRTSTTSPSSSSTSAQMRVALDHLGQHGRWVTWGPGRHSMAHNLFGYVRMPEEELFVELYCDMELLQPDHDAAPVPRRPARLERVGQLPPRTYFRFDEEAIRSEAEQREALAAASGTAVS